MPRWPVMAERNGGGARGPLRKSIVVERMVGGRTFEEGRLRRKSSNASTTFRDLTDPRKSAMKSWTVRSPTGKGVAIAQGKPAESSASVRCAKCVLGTMVALRFSLHF